MPAKVSCYCGKQLTVSDRYRGKKIRCPDCDEILVVSSGSSMQDAGNYAEQQGFGYPDDEHEAEYASTGVSPTVWIVGGSVILVALVFIVTLLLSVENKKATKDRQADSENRTDDRNRERDEKNNRRIRLANRGADHQRSNRSTSKTQSIQWPTRSWSIERNYKSSLSNKTPLKVAREYSISAARQLGRERLLEAGTARVLRWAEHRNRSHPGMVVLVSIDDLEDVKKNTPLPRSDIEKRVRNLHKTQRQFQMEEIETGKIHGMAFSRLYWDSAGSKERPSEPLRGVDYLAHDGLHFIHISAWDRSENSPNNLLTAEAMIQSFERNPVFVENEAEKENEKPLKNGESVASTNHSTGATIRLVPSSSEDQKKESTKTSAWSSGRRQITSGWGGNQPSVRIPLLNKHNSRVTYSIGYHPYVLIDQTVFDSRTGKPLGDVPADEEDRNEVVTVSSDGHAVAIGSSERKEIISINIYETATGKKKTIINLSSSSLEKKASSRTRRGRRTKPKKKPTQPPRKLSLRHLRFVANDSLLLVSLWMRNVIVDLETGKALYDIKLRFLKSSSQITFSSDGQLLAVGSSDGVFVYNMNSGKAIASMAAPKGPDGKYLRLFHCKGLAFSPDLQELAGWFDDHLIVWNKKNKVIYYEPVTGERGFAEQKQFNLQWLPDQSGWLLAGREIYDRKRKIKILLFQSPTFFERLPHRFLDNDRILVSRMIASDIEMAALDIPWGSIETARKMLDSNAGTHIAPGNKVSIRLNVAKVSYASPLQVKQQLKQTLEKRLERFQIKVADSQPTIFEINYSEEPGRLLHIVEGGFGLIGGHDSGRRVQETVGKIQIVLKVQGENQPLWKWKTESRTGRISNVALTPSNLRKEMFKSIQSRVGDLDFPRYISKDKNAPRLPLIIDLGDRNH